MSVSQAHVWGLQVGDAASRADPEDLNVALQMLLALEWAELGPARLSGTLQGF